MVFIYLINLMRHLILLVMSKDHSYLDETYLSSRIKIASVYDVEPHEEYISSLLEELLHKIRLSNLYTDPILTDISRGLVIDGTHRLYAMRKLGYNYIPVIDFDYLKDDIKLYRWLRVFKNGYDQIFNIINRRHPLQKIGNVEDELNLIDETGISIIYKGEIYTYRFNRPWVDEFKELDKIISIYEPGFIEDRELERRIDEYPLIICYKKIDKNEVVRNFSKGRRFSYKTTRHIPPFRIFDLNVPLRYLNNLEDALRYLSRIKIVYVGNRIFYKDRFYEEHIYRGFPK